MITVDQQRTRLSWSTYRIPAKLLLGSTRIVFLGSGSTGLMTDQMWYLHIQFVPHRKLCVSVTKTSRLIMFREIIAVSKETHTKHINPLLWQSEVRLMVKQVVPIVTIKRCVSSNEGSVNALSCWYANSVPYSSLCISDSQERNGFFPCVWHLKYCYVNGDASWCTQINQQPW